EFYSVLFVGFMTIYSVGAWVSNRRLAFWVRFILVTLQLTGALVAVMLVNGAEQLTEEALAEIDPGELLYYVSTSLILSFGYYLSACYLGGQSRHRAKQRWKLQQAHDKLAAQTRKLLQQQYTPNACTSLL